MLLLDPIPGANYTTTTYIDYEFDMDSLLCEMGVVCNKLIVMHATIKLLCTLLIIPFSREDKVY